MANARTAGTTMQESKEGVIHQGIWGMDLRTTQEIDRSISLHKFIILPPKSVSGSPSKAIMIYFQLGEIYLKDLRSLKYN